MNREHAQGVKPPKINFRRICFSCLEEFSGIKFCSFGAFTPICCVITLFFQFSQHLRLALTCHSICDDKVLHPEHANAYHWAACCHTRGMSPLLDESSSIHHCSSLIDFLYIVATILHRLHVPQVKVITVALTTSGAA